MDNKEILITGGTGTLGKTLTKILIEKYKPKGIRIFSRDEFKQWEMAKNFKGMPVSFLIGDIRDKDRIELACRGVNIIFHTAALKQVDTAEKNPLETINTNIMGSQNVLMAALNNKSTIEKVMGISTDKAVYPINLYGATKLCMEKLFINGNVYSGGRQPRFSICRYGNVLGSRGSVIELFKKQLKNRKITITDSRMSRFWITIERAANFIIDSAIEMQGSETFVPKMPSAKIETIAEYVANKENISIKDVEIKYTGLRPGEKLHEILITKDESYRIFQNDKRFKIIQDIILPANIFEYSSDNNGDFLSVNGIDDMVKGN